MSYRKHAALFAGKWAAQEARKVGYGDNLADTGIARPAERTMSERVANEDPRPLDSGSRTGSITDLATGKGRGLSSPLTPSKYRNVREGAYATKREAKRAAVLRLLERSGAISGLREQVEFVLIPRQLDEHGKVAERACIYRADFVYTDNATGLEVVEDCKGMRTKEYVIKRKLMRFTHGVVILET